MNPVSLPRCQSSAAPDVAVVLPMREQVMSGRAGAVALNVSEFGRSSTFRERLLVFGGTERGDFLLPYRRVSAAHLQFWRRASERYAAAVADAIEPLGCRLVEIHNRAPLFRRLARRLGERTRLCLYLHNDAQLMAGMRTPLERSALLQRGSLIYCLSGYIRDRFLAGTAGPAERVVVLPNGMCAMPMAGLVRQPTILFVGRLVPEKGVEELFAALRRIAVELPDWRVAIIGRAPPRHRARYRGMLADLRMVWRERLRVIETLPHAEVMREFAEAAITVVPSRWQEPFGRTALEALSAGSAVIASASGGLPEIVGEAGLLLDSATPEAIAGAILSLARDPVRRTLLGQAGQARVAERFDIGELSRRLDARRRVLLDG